MEKPAIELQSLSNALVVFVTGKRCGFIANNSEAMEGNWNSSKLEVCLRSRVVLISEIPVFDVFAVSYCLWAGS